MTCDPAVVEQALAPLIGEPLTSLGRAGLIWLSFGPDVETVVQYGPRKGTRRMVGTYALHLQCPWRLMRGDEVLIGSHDLFIPRTGQEPTTPEGWDAWDWSARGANRFDELAEAWNAAGPYRVSRVRARAIGDLCVELEHGLQLDVFVDSASDRECWRYLRPATEERHFVMLGCGIEA